MIHQLAPAFLCPGKTHLAGATWPYDSTSEAPQLTKHSKVTLFEQHGCGAVTHLHASNYLVQGDTFGKTWYNPAVRGLIIRVWYDGNTQPAIQMPFMDFFADIDCQSDFFSTVFFSKVRYSHNFRLPMPFRQHIKIEVENTTGYDMTGYTEIQWDTCSDLPEDCGYLHTEVHEGKALLPGDKIEVCDIKGRGAIAAHWLKLSAEDPLCANGERLCEGNHRFFMDGEDVPGMESQGTEDFYNYSWGFRDTGTDHYAAILRREDLPSGGAQIALLRCRDKDAIRFEMGCRGMIDYTQEYFSALSANPRHKGNQLHQFTADYKNCCYYYAIDRP